MQASTSEIYGDPVIHPQVESYWGNVNPIGIRSCYDEGKRCAETLFMDYYRQNGIRIKIIRIFNTYGPRMLPDDGRVVFQLCGPGTAGQGHHDLRFGCSDPQFPVCGRLDRGDGAYDEYGRRVYRPGKFGQSQRVLHP